MTLSHFNPFSWVQLPVSSGSCRHHAASAAVIGGRATLKMLRHKSKTQFAKHDRNTHNAIALLNYLKRIAPPQIMLRTLVFKKKF
jgi:hypothetical protein